jgi:hypothetical protein
MNCNMHGEKQHQQLPLLLQRSCCGHGDVTLAGVSFDGHCIQSPHVMLSLLFSACSNEDEDAEAPSLHEDLGWASAEGSVADVA